LKSSNASGVKAGYASGPRTVDIFRSTLSAMTLDTIDTLKRIGFFKEMNNFETQGYVKYCVQMATEIWILSFGVHVLDINSDQFAQCFLNVQQVNQRYRWGLDQQDLEKLFWLTGSGMVEESDSIESIKKMSLAEFCIIFTWLGMPDMDHPISAHGAVRRAYDWIHESKNRMNCFEGICSSSQAEFLANRRFPPAVLRIPEGTIESSTMTLPSSLLVKHTKYCIRNLICTRIDGKFFSLF
jgi:hypothetical protein